MKHVICYINQFFGGVGGEEKADQEPYIVEGTVGPTMAINGALKDAQVTHTIVCGDNFMGSRTDEAVERILQLLEGKQADLFIAGPAFQAGRYGVACGTPASLLWAPRLRDTSPVAAATSISWRTSGRTPPPTGRSRCLSRK